MPLKRFNPYPIQWYEGMFLVPQHFQQSDLRLQNLIEYHLNRLNPYYWGVANVLVDDAQLVNGLLRILSLEAILPDGTPIFFPDTPEEPLTLDLSSINEIKEGEPFKVFVCIPDNITDAFDQTTDIHARYMSVESAMTKDINTGDSPLRISRLKPRLFLAVGDRLSRSCSFPLVELVREGGKFSKTSFIPPQLSVSLESALGQNCLALTRKIREKVIYLQSKIHTHHSALGLEKATEALEALRQHLVVGLLSFEAVLNTGKSHPFEIFKALSVLTAHGFALKQGEYPPIFAPYNHDGLEATFNQLLVFIEDVLETIEEAYVTISLTQKERVYSVFLEPEWLNAPLIFGARAQPGSTEDDMVRWAQEAVIATDSYIDRVQENRILGASRDFVNSVPSLNLVPSRNTVLFSVAIDRRFIAAEETLRIFNISDTDKNRPQQVNLYLPNTLE
ncbi:MAG: type VI secretion system baseplate subunit TssK [Holosporales bacterium]|nr:type VI secretion system baseplate subunit TssK [Holosporales bacterium]